MTKRPRAQGDREGKSRERILGTKVVVGGRPNLTPLPSYASPSQTIMTSLWVILIPVCLLHLPMNSTRAGTDSVLIPSPHLTMMSAHGFAE